jgi:hypothetical protein
MKARTSAALKIRTNVRGGVRVNNLANLEALLTSAVLVVVAACGAEPEPAEKVAEPVGQAQHAIMSCWEEGADPSNCCGDGNCGEGENCANCGGDCLCGPCDPAWDYFCRP